MKALKLIGIALLGMLLGSCFQPDVLSFGEIVDEVHKHTPVIELVSNEGKSRLAITPELQGKVIASTYDGFEGESNGWLDLEAWRENPVPSTNIGGEDRLWIGPLGGQHSFYYQQVKPLHEDNWLVPQPLKEGAYHLVNQGSKFLRMQQKMQMTNFIGTPFELCVMREISLLEADEIAAHLGHTVEEELKFVAYECRHQLINTGSEAWTPEKGMASIWSLNTLRGTNQTVVGIPLIPHQNPPSLLTYLGPLGRDRLTYSPDSILFKADGRYRTKIGIPPEIAPRIFGSYSPEYKRLTIIQYSKGGHEHYFNSNVSSQQDPYQGEAISVYNHGRLDLKPSEQNTFFEMETASAMLPLSPGGQVSHVHRIFHFSGPEEQLEALCLRLLGINLVKKVKADGVSGPPQKHKI